MTGSAEVKKRFFPPSWSPRAKAADESAGVGHHGRGTLRRIGLIGLGASGASRGCQASRELFRPALVQMLEGHVEELSRGTRDGGVAGEPRALRAESMQATVFDPALALAEEGECDASPEGGEVGESFASQVDRSTPCRIGFLDDDDGNYPLSPTMATLSSLSPTSINSS